MKSADNLLPSTAVWARRVEDQSDQSWNQWILALWYDAKGDWKKAHEMVDGPEDLISAHVHAYLHRKEGDEWNAGYWYRRAGKPVFKGSLEAEWQELVNDYFDF
jgi:hypothetical protein